MTLMRWKPRRDLWDPFGNLTEIQDEVNRLFDTSLRRTGAGYEGLFTPAIDVVEEKDNLLVRAELPGLTKDDVNVSLQDNILTIRGEKKSEVETKDESVYHRETVYGSFSRTIQLPVAVDAKKIDASFQDGVLRVTLPKSEEAKPRQIEVKVS